MENFGERLKTFIQSQSSLGTFAKTLGVTNTSLSRYISGERMFPIELLPLLAQHGCNIHWLLTGEGAMYAPSGSQKLYTEKEALELVEQILKERKEKLSA